MPLAMTIRTLAASALRHSQADRAGANVWWPAEIPRQNPTDARDSTESDRVELTQVERVSTKRLRWTDAQVLDALREASTYDHPLMSTKYDWLISVGEIEGPTASRIGKRFGSWAAACAAAGVEAARPTSTHTRYRGTDLDLLLALGRYLQDAPAPHTRTAFERWRRTEVVETPSSSLIGTRFGTWAEAKRRAGDHCDIRDEVRV